MEENPDESCKNAIATTNIPSNATSSHFISMAIRNHPKLTIKIPKFMDKIMRGRKSRRSERGYHQFPKKVVSDFFSRVFGKKRLLDEKAEDHGDSESLLGRSDSHEGKEKLFTAEGNDLVRRNERIVGSLSQLMKLELDDALRPHDDAEEGKHKNAIVALESIVDGNGEAEGEKTDNVVNGWEVWRMKVRSSRLVRVVSSIMSITSWLKKKVSKEVEDEEEEEEEEGEEEEEEACLCKRRILMGGRCKPLYSSGTLEYDSDGILIPDHLLWD